MKTRIKPIFQYAFIAILFFSWIDYQSMTDEEAIFESVIKKEVAYNNPIDKIASCTDNLIHRSYDLIEKYPNEKFVVEKMKEAKEIIGELYSEITEYQDDFYKVEEEKKWSWENVVEPDLALLPLNYNKEEAIVEIFSEQEEAIKLSWNIEEQLTKLNKVCKVQKNRSVFGYKNLNRYNEQLAKKLEHEVNVIAYVLNTQQFKKDIQRYDVVHANALLNALKYQLKILELELIQNMFNLLSKKDNFKVDYMLVHSMETPKMGKTTGIDIFPTTYINSPHLDFHLNGKHIEDKDGVATFKYTPKTSGDKYFNVKIVLTNPYTLKKEIYKETFRNYAID